MMILKRLGWGLLIAAAGIAAPALLWWMMVTSRDQIAVGPWRTSLVAGSADADMSTRTYIAITALLALNRSETIYFEAQRDDDGRKLQAGCDYDVSGGPIQSRWWSITAYASDNFLIPNVIDRYSYNVRSLSGAPDGRYVIALGPRERPGHWLPSGDKGGNFNLLLRLYNPDADLAQAPAKAVLPSIRRVGDCRS